MIRRIVLYDNKDLKDRYDAIYMDDIPVEIFNQLSAEFKIGYNNRYSLMRYPFEDERLARLRFEYINEQRIRNLVGMR